MTIIKGILAFALFLGVFYLVLNSNSVKQSEYHHCMVTSTDKQLCADILN